MRQILGFACAVMAILTPVQGRAVLAVRARPVVQATRTAGAAPPARALAAERKLAAAVDETRMVDTVKRLVAFGPRQYGTPSNHEAAAWLASAFREAGLEVTVREDPPRNWYQPVSWEIRASADWRGCVRRRPQDDLAQLGRAVGEGRGRALARDSAGRSVPDLRQPDAGVDGRVRGGARRRPRVGLRLARREPAARDVDRSRLRGVAEGNRAAARETRRRRQGAGDVRARREVGQLRGAHGRGDARPGATARSTSCSAPTATRTPAGPAPTTTRRASPSSSKSRARWRRR